MFIDGLDEAFDHALSPLERIRDVQELIFTKDMADYNCDERLHHKLGTDQYKERLKALLKSPKAASN